MPLSDAGVPQYRPVSLIDRHGGALPETAIRREPRQPTISIRSPTKENEGGTARISARLSGVWARSSPEAAKRGVKERRA